MIKGRIRMPELKLLCGACSGDTALTEALFALVADADDRVSYNALWIFTHFSAAARLWLLPKRDVLIDMLLSQTHVGKRRLILTLLEGMPTSGEDLRTDYLDFCLSKINSSDPYAIRAFCLKQAFAQCCLHPGLLAELEAEMAMMDCGELSPGLASARRIVRRRMARLKR